MEISRSSFYALPADRPDDGRIVGEMQAIADEFEAYGYCRMTGELRHRGLVVNAKKVRRLMRENNLNPRHRRRYVATTDSDHDQISKITIGNCWIGFQILNDDPERLALVRSAMDIGRILVLAGALAAAASAIAASCLIA